MLSVAKIHNFLHSIWNSKVPLKKWTKFLNNIPLLIEVAMCFNPWDISEHHWVRILGNFFKRSTHPANKYFPLLFLFFLPANYYRCDAGSGDELELMRQQASLRMTKWKGRRNPGYISSREPPYQACGA